MTIQRIIFQNSQLLIKITHKQESMKCFQTLKDEYESFHIEWDFDVFYQGWGAGAARKKYKEPEPLGKKIRSRSRLKKKSGAGADSTALVLYISI